MHAGVAAFVILVLVGCDRSDDGLPSTDTVPTRVTFETGTATFITADREIPIRIEIAERPEQRAYGLMDRDVLDEDAGMAFLYNDIQSANTGFWMYRTRIPLDIAFFDGAGRIVAIQQMTPCPSLDTSRCPGYPAGAPYFGAIEVNRGYLARQGIGVGDRIVIEGRVGQ